MYTTLQKILVLSLVSVLFAACSKHQDDYVSLDDRVVPAESGQSTQASVDSEDVEQGETAVVDTPVAVPVGPFVSLRDKILANSDVSEKALDNAFKYFDSHQSVIRNKNYMSIFDIGQHSGKRRLYMIDLNTGDVKSMHVSHGSGSDSNHDGIATSFSNVSGSNQSSLGFMLTAEEYVGKHGGSMRLDGLESRNSKVRSRAIVVHSASYVDPSLSKMGRSQGCPAVSVGNIKDVVAKLKNGSLYYIYHKDYDGNL